MRLLTALAETDLQVTLLIECLAQDPSFIRAGAPDM